MLKRAVSKLVSCVISPDVVQHACGDKTWQDQQDRIAIIQPSELAMNMLGPASHSFSQAKPED